MNQTRGAGGSAATISLRLARIAASAWFAYGSLLLIQAKVLWGIWEHRDLTSGDTSMYFVDASRWSESLHLDPIWSPMYTSFWGSLHWVVSDPYAVTILHRVLIAFAASLLVLAVLRRLLTPGIAWALAVWWAILPIGYDTLYEVHLFALVPQLIAVLIALRWSGLRMRSAVFGVLLAATVLMRNELLVALAVWVGAWIVDQLRERRRGEGAATAELVRAVAIPVLVVGVVTAAAVLSWPDKGGLSGRSESKHTVNVCQIYAFGYQQRHDDFTGSPWTECGELMQRDFGERRPSFTEAFADNPDAIIEHVGWNLRLSPYAVQLLLFNRISADGRHNPDYAEVTTGSVASRIGLLIVAAFIAGGLLLLWRERRRWWDDWIAERAWGWLALGALAASATAVMIWQRPRPSYLFGLGVLLFAVIGMCAMAYADRWPALRRLAATPPLLAVALLIALPSHYGPDYQTEQIGRPDRPLKATVERLHPLRDTLRGSDVHLLATYADPACSYIGGAEPCTPVTWEEPLGRGPGIPLARSLDNLGVDYVYVDETDLAEPAVAEAVSTARASGWATVAGGPSDQPWLLLERPGLGAAS